MIIVAAIHSVLGIAKEHVLYKAFQQSESLRTQISCFDCRQCPSQGALRSCCCSSGDSRRNGERLSKCLSGNHKQYREKARSRSFSVPAVSRLLLFALYTVPYTLAQWSILSESKVRVSTENTVSLWGQCIPLSHGCSGPQLLEVISHWKIKRMPTEVISHCMIKRMPN